MSPEIEILSNLENIAITLEENIMAGLKGKLFLNKTGQLYEVTGLGIWTHGMFVAPDKDIIIFVKEYDRTTGKYVGEGKYMLQKSLDNPVVSR